MNKNTKKQKRLAAAAVSISLITASITASAMTVTYTELGVRCCYNCSFCSWRYPNMKEACDLDEHEINDDYTERCGKYEEADDNE